MRALGSWNRDVLSLHLHDPHPVGPKASAGTESNSVDACQKLIHSLALNKNSRKQIRFRLLVTQQLI